jgi:hypothetical protein
MNQFNTHSDDTGHGHGAGMGLVISFLLWMIFAAVRAYI